MKKASDLKMKIDSREIDGAITKALCEHVEECKASSQVLFYLDACADCDIAPKFKK